LERGGNGPLSGEGKKKTLMAGEGGKDNLGAWKEKEGRIAIGKKKKRRKKRRRIPLFLGMEKKRNLFWRKKEEKRGSGRKEKKIPC